MTDQNNSVLADLRKATVALRTGGDKRATLVYLVPNTEGVLAIHPTLDESDTWTLSHVLTGLCLVDRATSPIQAELFGCWVWANVTDHAGFASDYAEGVVAASGSRVRAFLAAYWNVAKASTYLLKELPGPAGKYEDYYRIRYQTLKSREAALAPQEAAIAQQKAELAKLMDTAKIQQALADAKLAQAVSRENAVWIGEQAVLGRQNLLRDAEQELQTGWVELEATRQLIIDSLYHIVRVDRDVGAIPAVRRLRNIKRLNES